MALAARLFIIPAVAGTGPPPLALGSLDVIPAVAGMYLTAPPRRPAVPLGGGTGSLEGRRRGVWCLSLVRVT